MNYGIDTKTKAKFIFIVALTIILAVPASGASADATDDQLAASQQKLQQLNRQISTYLGQIGQIQAQASSLKNEVAIYNNQIAATQLSIEANQTRTDQANLQISQLQRQIYQQSQNIQSNQQVLSRLIVELNQEDDRYALQTTIASDNFADFLDQVQYNQNLQSQIYQLVEKIKTLKAGLQTQQRDLQIQLAQLQSLQQQLQVSQASLTQIRNQKQQLLVQTQGREASFQKLLAGSKQDAVNLQKEIENLDNQVRARLGNSAAIAASAGLLAWPIDGIVTQGYGKTGFTSLGYDFHNGIDIAGPPGQPIYAALDGTVLDDDQSNQDFGNWVALKNTVLTAAGPAQIVTLYGHMEKFVVTVGQQLKQGDLIGYEGNTGNTTAKLYGPERGYHLHFGVYDYNGFSVSQGAYTKIYGPYKIPYGYTYDPLTFLPPNPN